MIRVQRIDDHLWWINTAATLSTTTLRWCITGTKKQTTEYTRQTCGGNTVVLRLTSAQLHIQG
ncbi:unnamed protein product [Brugia timori]|uniref:Uncharacterized protein n=1 Tax=Brugia timori TaxID=42155 RepID=A0A3P7Y022_9BILA|nr:unnamed protein product [Brugia timori]